jgi:hypothetical protein
VRTEHGVMYGWLLLYQCMLLVRAVSFQEACASGTLVGCIAIAGCWSFSLLTAPLTSIAMCCG